MGKRKGNSEKHSRNKNLDHEVELRGRLGSPDMKVDPKDVSESNEVRFGRHLAHSSDKYTRDRTVGALKVWLSRRSKADKLTDLDLLQIWKGLWYSMWLCDKAAVQLELAESLGRLIFVYTGQLEEGLRFFRFFCKTMQVQWGQVDHLRVDKYYTLIRMVLRGSLRFCLDEEVEEGATKSFPGTTVRRGLLAFMDILQDEILEKLPNGLRLHISDIVLDELWRASCQPSSTSSELSTLEFLLALEPFFSVLQAGGVKGQGPTSSAFFKRVYDRILRRLPTDIFYEGYDEKQDNGRITAEASEEEWRMLFPRVSLPAIQGRVFALASDKATPDKHREDIYAILENIQAITMERGSGSQNPVHEVVRKMWLERKGPVSSAKHGIPVYGWAAAANGNGELEGGVVDSLNNEAAPTEVTGRGEVQKVPVVPPTSLNTRKNKRKNSRQGQQLSEECGETHQKSGAEEADNTTKETAAVRKQKKRNLSTNDEPTDSSRSGLTKASSSRTKITHSSMTPSAKQTTKQQQEETNGLGRAPSSHRHRVTFGETHFKPYSESMRHLRRLTPEKANGIDITPSKSSLKKVRCKYAASGSSNDEVETMVVKESRTITPTVKTRKKVNQRPQLVTHTNNMAAFLAQIHRQLERFVFKPSPRRAQELRDIRDAFLATRALRFQLDGLHSDPAEAMVAALNIVNGIHPSSVNRLLQRELNHQVIKATEIISVSLKHGRGNIVASGTTDELAGFVERSREVKKMRQGKNQGNTTDGVMNLRPAQQHSVALLKEKLGYAMRVKPSSIEGAGWGLWVDGIAPTGSVVSMFPGVVYAPKLVRDPKYQQELFPDPDFQLVMRCDNYVVDCKESAKCPWHPWYALKLMTIFAPIDLRDVAYDIPAASDADWWASKNEIFPLELRCHIPCKYRKIPGFLDGKLDKKILMEGMLLVAMNDLENEEVFVNYRLPKTTWHPDWYHPVDKQEDDNRWEGVWK